MMSADATGMLPSFALPSDENEKARVDAGFFDGSFCHSSLSMAGPKN
jgi:hypothetical protein